MSNEPDDHEALQEFVRRLSREQPLRPAPPELGARVLRAIAERASMPWWRRSFTHWPTPVRAAFVVACLLVVGGSVSLTLWSSIGRFSAALIAPVSGPLSWIQGLAGAIFTTGSVLTHAGTALSGSVSPVFIYGGVLGVGALYALFAGLCAATYRSLYVAR